MVTAATATARRARLREKSHDLVIADDPFSVSAPRDLADAIAEERHLQVPVDVRSLVEEYADIRERFFPPTVRADAVISGLHGNDVGLTRPVLLARRDVPETRAKFTLAHELGHLSMAWHIGTISCDVSSPDSNTASENARAGGPVVSMEREANKFASRILVPSTFVKTLDLQDPSSMLAELERAEISPEAAIYSLASHLLPGCIFALMDPDGRVGAVSLSYGTFPVRVYRNQTLGDDFHSLCRETGSVRLRGQRVVWGRIESARALTTDTDQWEPILERILPRAVAGEVRGGSLWNTANAVAAAANSEFGNANLPILASKIWLRFKRRPPPWDAIVADPEFDDFVSARAIAFVTRPKRPRNGRGQKAARG